MRLLCECLLHQHLSGNSLFQIVVRQVGTAFGKQLGGNKMSQFGFSDLGFVCGVTCYSGHMLSRLRLD